MKPGPSLLDDEVCVARADTYKSVQLGQVSVKLGGNNVCLSWLLAHQTK